MAAWLRTLSDGVEVERGGEKTHRDRERERRAESEIRQRTDAVPMAGPERSPFPALPPPSSTCSVRARRSDGSPAPAATVPRRDFLSHRREAAQPQASASAHDLTACRMAMDGLLKHRRGPR